MTPVRRLRLARPRGRRLLVAALAALLVVGGTLGLVLRAGSGAAPAETRRQVPVTDGPTDAEHVDLDTDLFVPRGVDAAHPAPAVVLSHGFGGSLDDERGDALDAARRGYVVLTYSARGFGRSTGLVGLDSPDYEVKDVEQLITMLAQRPDVVHDSASDPRVGLAGGSYGGGVSLLTAAYDPRVDAVAADITWNDLATSLAPGGVFKQGWASDLFGLSAVRPGVTPQVCPGFTPEACAAYADTEASGEPSAQTVALLHRSSVADVIGRLRVPTLLVQGEQDTLFPLQQADVTADALRAAHVPVKEVWVQGGHDGGFAADDARVRDLTGAWFDRWLRRDRAVRTGPGFEAARTGAGIFTAETPPTTGALTAAPGALLGRGTLTALGASASPADGSLTIVNPPGGEPAALTSLPGQATLTALAGGLSVALPPQTAAFDGPVLRTPLEVLGASSARLRVTSSTGTAVLFASLVDVDADGTAHLPYGQLVPVRLTGLPTSGQGRLVDLALPVLSWRFATGHHLRLQVATTDQAWLGSRVGASYSIGTDGATLTVQPSPSPAGGGLRPLLVALVALLALALVAAAMAVLVGRRHRRERVVATAAAAGVSERVPPVEIRGLVKEYADGTRAVDGLDLVVRHGQVLGLLGPNGAGKTTTLRMLLGLIAPTGGEVRLFGTPVTPGSPALQRVGAFVEGPGFAPALSGLDNLRLWWTASGARWEDSQSEEALEVAGLGDAVHRKVRTYSQGMRQRLAIAQAMLGRPDLVVLDEPTNGLDPPQIVEMRRVIRDLADRGVTVLVSSHLLSEVEQVCTHVAVVSRGRTVASGTVDEVVGADRAVSLETPDPVRAEQVLTALPGVGTVERQVGGLLVALEGARRADLVRALVEAGVEVEALTPRRALEEAFLELVS